MTVKELFDELKQHLDQQEVKVDCSDWGCEVDIESVCLDENLGVVKIMINNKGW